LTAGQATEDPAAVLLEDLADFVTRHRACGKLTGDATEPAWNGYLLTVACSCGVVFMRWVTPEDVVRGLVAVGTARRELSLGLPHLLANDERRLVAVQALGHTRLDSALGEQHLDGATHVRFRHQAGRLGEASSPSTARTAATSTCGSKCSVK
jgi:hypothetical protein